MKNLIKQFIKNEDGVTAIEYALIGVAMAVVVGAAMSTMTPKLKTAFTAISTAITTATTTATAATGS